MKLAITTSVSRSDTYRVQAERRRTVALDQSGVGGGLGRSLGALQLPPTTTFSASRMAATDSSYARWAGFSRAEKNFEKIKEEKGKGKRIKTTLPGRNETRCR